MLIIALISFGAKGFINILIAVEDLLLFLHDLFCVGQIDLVILEFIGFVNWVTCNLVVNKNFFSNLTVAQFCSIITSFFYYLPRYLSYCYYYDFYELYSNNVVKDLNMIYIYIFFFSFVLLVSQLLIMPLVIYFGFLYLHESFILLIGKHRLKSKVKTLEILNCTLTSVSEKNIKKVQLV